MPEVVDLVRASVEAAFEGVVRTRNQAVVFPNGQKVWFTIRYMPITSEGEVEAVAFIAADVSREAQAMREKEAFYQALNLLDVGVTIADVEGDHALQFVNDGFCKMTGYRREEVLGRNCRFLQDDLEQGPELERLRSILEKHEAGTVTLRNRRVDGSIFLHVILQSSQLALEETDESNVARPDLKIIEKSANHAREL